MDTYIVKSGDTLYGISNQFGVSVSDILRANNLSNTNIKVGDKLLIPALTGTNPNNIIKYTVKKGDTFFMGNNE